jgi:hypothetical protein
MRRTLRNFAISRALVPRRGRDRDRRYPRGSHKGSRRPSHDEQRCLRLGWEWAHKPVDNKPTIDAAIYDAVMALPSDERRDRAKVNEAAREGLRLGPLRSAGSADLHGVPKATE